VTAVRVGLRCDADVQTGVGHLVRCVALAEELAARTVQVAFLGTVDGVPWARAQLTDRGFPLYAGPVDAAGLVATAREHGLDAMVLDSYTLDPGAAAALRAHGVATLAIVDGDARGQAADLYLDQNLGAERHPLAGDAGGRRLAGLRYVLLRDVVRAARPADPPAPRPTNRPRVLCFAGGTDPLGAVPVLARLVLAAEVPVELTVVAARPAVRAALASMPPRRAAITVRSLTDDLPRLAAAADLVLSASGTSTWELLCLGVPPALTWVADNQRLGYARAVGEGLAAGLGRLDELDTPGSPAAEAAVATLRRLLTDPVGRAELGARGWQAVDGRGRARVADAVLAEVRRRAAVTR
jgi:spore coat polysaccharide biosynthesis predicted glycosyltransferase SpsG